MFMPFYWRDVMLNILPSGSDGLIVVFENTCNQTFTYQIDGPDVEFLGFGDHHDPKYKEQERVSTLENLKNFATGNIMYTGLRLSDDVCSYTIHIYPSEAFEDEYTSSDPWIYTFVAVSIFLFTSVVFFIYDKLVERRQKKVMSTAVKSSAIVSSLFPSNVRARLYDLDGKEDSLATNASQKNRLKSFMNEETTDDDAHLSSTPSPGVRYAGRPIADLFPEATVMFGDIAGFTAWSSTRQPSQVFILLESLYGMFDTLAARRSVFKVETIGDCYVAVAGLPDPRHDHAIVIAKFARDCSLQLKDLTAKLAVTLGPDTEDLSMRFGLNSGPVTVGVLRGQKSRFQLFGDTVNTASRLESSGQKNRIHVSQSTADELTKHNKRHWLHARKETVEVKGKGRMPTYWVTPREGPALSNGSAGNETETLLRSSVGIEPAIPCDSYRGSSLGARIEILLDWNTDVLARLVRGIVRRRKTHDVSEADMFETSDFVVPLASLEGSHVIDEVKAIIAFPDFDPVQASINDLDDIVLDPLIMSQLRGCVSAIAMTYGRSSNPFHNFEHASHVCMSVAKLMSRIVAADEFFDHDMDAASLECFKHHRTFGITSDPLTLFACAFAALVHDADHPGVPNTQLVKEGTDLAKKYRNRSVAEQRSVDLAWGLFMSDGYGDLRRIICPNQSELARFRQLVVNSVMATDIMDVDLKRLRNERWDKAFESSTTDIAATGNPNAEVVNRKATIVIEHLIQASDVAHTMQHWHVYRKWNERLFVEMVKAYEEGRADKDPRVFWYKGELGFFDFYILPLAKKLSECGVFGVSSDEYLNYAVKNREEWELKGEQVVAEMIERLNTN